MRLALDNNENESLYPDFVLKKHHEVNIEPQYELRAHNFAFILRQSTGSFTRLPKICSFQNIKCCVALTPPQLSAPQNSCIIQLDKLHTAYNSM